MVTQSGEAGIVTPDRNPDPHPRQIVVYRQYLKLQSIAAARFSGSLAGRLILSVGFGLRGAELAVASTIAGGAFLGIEPDSQRLKAAVRNGSCDFMVNTLDEALRVLKNELRKGTPLSAGLLGDASGILPAMAERGVQPDLIADTSLSQPGTSPTSQKRDVGHPVYLDALARMIARGAEMLTLDAEMTETLLLDEVIWAAANPQDLRCMDMIALESIPAEDQVRRRWVEQAAGYFYRQLPLERVLGLSPEERTKMIDAFKGANAAAALQSPAIMRWRSGDGSEQTVTL
jgi:urocanate hydratase